MKFVRCQTHPKCPDVIGWYVKLGPDDLDLLMKLHKGVAIAQFLRVQHDPHFQKEEVAHLYNPVRLTAGWFQTVEKMLLAGETVLVNPCGGVLLLKGVKILAEIECEKLIWPEYWSDEIITISRWPGGNHYYLSSSKNRVFDPYKYTVYEDTLAVAKKFTNNIRSKC